MLNACLKATAGPRPFENLAKDCRGDVALEYIALVATIALPAIAAFVAVGKAIVDDYTTLQNILVLPLP